jgi:hypothetical protein
LHKGVEIQKQDFRKESSENGLKTTRTSLGW